MINFIFPQGYGEESEAKKVAVVEVGPVKPARLARTATLSHVLTCHDSKCGGDPPQDHVTPGLLLCEARHIASDSTIRYSIRMRFENSLVCGIMKVVSRYSG